MRNSKHITGRRTYERTILDILGRRLALVYSTVQFALPDPFPLPKHALVCILFIIGNSCQFQLAIFVIIPGEEADMQPNRPFGFVMLKYSTFRFDRGRKYCEGGLILGPKYSEQEKHRPLKRMMTLTAGNASRKMQLIDNSPLHYASIPIAKCQQDNITKCVPRPSFFSAPLFQMTNI